MISGIGSASARAGNAAAGGTLIVGPSTLTCGASTLTCAGGGAAILTTGAAAGGITIGAAGGGIASLINLLSAAAPANSPRLTAKSASKRRLPSALSVILSNLFWSIVACWISNLRLSISGS